MARGKKTGGRQKGTPNKASQPFKQLMREVCEDPTDQQILRDFLRANPAFYFKAADHAFGTPRQSLDLNTSDRRWLQWPDNRDVDDGGSDGCLPPAEEPDDPEAA